MKRLSVVIDGKENRLNKGLRPVRVPLVGEDGNAFAILGRFRRLARQQGWPEDQISLVSKACHSGNYEHLLSTIVSVTYENLDELEYYGFSPDARIDGDEDDLDVYDEDDE